MDSSSELVPQGGKDGRIKNADSVWLLMGKEYRISRSIRVQWFFQHINTVVAPKENEIDIINSCEELEVLSVLSNDHSTCNLQIVPTTRLSFVGRQYRFVFCIDMTPSLATVDSESGNVLLDEMFDNLKNCLTGLVQPFFIPGSTLELKPRLHVTILTHTYINVKECKVLVQGYCVNSTNVKFFLCQLKRKLQILEKSVAEDVIKRNLKEKEENDESNKNQFKRSETILFYIIRDSLFALQLLPENASAAIVVVTDGVFILENALVADALLAKVRHSTAVCSFLQVGTGYKRAAVEFGYVPNCELMQFIAAATSGAYLATCPSEDDKVKNYEMNMYHKALFCWNFQRDIDRDKIDSYQDTRGLMFATQSSLENIGYLNTTLKDTLPPKPQQTMRYMEFELQTKISSVLTVRSREGYITDGIRITKADDDKSQIEVKLVWPWKEHVTIEYIAKASWPVDESSRCKTHVIVKVSGPYEFLVDITSTKPKNHKTLRKTVLQRFDFTMKSLEFSDQLLVQLQYFPGHAYASQLPDIIAKGSPLFIMPSNATQPVLTLQYGSKKLSKTSEGQFANYWKPVFSMDTKSWTKWLHCHRISVLLEHDRPISKEFLVALSSGNFPQIYCRSAHSALNQLIKGWCTFTLLENHSYIKFVYADPDGPASTFCLMRLTFKGLCVVIRLAFLGGTPGNIRHRVVDDLKDRLQMLKAPIDKTVSKGNYSRDAANPLLVDQPCIIFLTKQFERIFVKYDNIPEDILSPQASPVHTSINPPPLVQNFNITTEQMKTPRSVLSQYLFNQRWVWNVRANEKLVLQQMNVSKILEKIMKQRLHEGFHYCSSSNKGIMTMVKEVQVIVDSNEENMSNSCVIQYVIFPPHQKVLAKNVLINDESAESDTLNESEGDLQMVMEIWVEPQIGTMDIPDSALSYINGAKYHEIPQKIFEVDSSIICEISSYVTIHMSCLNNDITICNTAIPSVEISSIISKNIFESYSNVNIPFLFDLVSLLHKSTLVVSMYPLMKLIQQDNERNSTSPNHILFTYLSSTLDRMNDQLFTLEPGQKKSLRLYIQDRCSRNNENVWCKEGCAPIFKPTVDGEDINLNCYVKTFGSTLIVTVIPTTVNDLSKWIQAPEDSLSPDTNPRQHIPFFIFECEYRTIQSVLFHHHNKDFVQDYTHALNESALTPRHMNQKLPENRSREMALFCQALYDRYFWALVSSVYNCLQDGYVLDTDDVELAIELVCEESIKEIDLTDFIRTICCHYRNEMITSTGFTFDDVVFNEALTPTVMCNKSLQKVQKRTSSASSSLVSSKTSMKQKQRECDNVLVQEEIKDQFTSILHKYFTPVPNNPYFMFYQESYQDGEESDNDDLHDVSHETVAARSSFSNMTDTSFDDGDSYSISGPESDHLNDEDDELQQDDTMEQLKTTNVIERPMFLHLTCSSHFKSAFGNSIRPISVTTLPTCIADILNKLGDCGQAFDPFSSNLTVTLDLICLTQPTEPDEGDEWKIPLDIKIARQDSSESFYSSQDNETDERNILVSQDSRDQSYLHHEMGDSLQLLPTKQKAAIENIEKEINWLLEDEIASALRTHGPVTEENLDKVAAHVQRSVVYKNCVFEKRYFMFVRGIERASALCLPLFIGELESATLDKYKLKRVGKYYCVVVNPGFEEEREREADQFNMQDIKNKAIIARKGFGHRRSQSDFTNNRQHFTENENLQTNDSKSYSLPDLYDSLEDYNLNLSVAGNLWETVDRSRGRRRIPIFSTSSSSKGESIPSLNQPSERYYLQRSLSYSERDDEMYELKRRRFSCPDIMNTQSEIFSDTTSETSEDKEELVLPPTRNSLISVKVESEMGYLEDDEDSMLQPHPDFWLFMNMSEESVDVFLHRRRSELSQNIEQQKTVYNHLLEAMDQICKIVNQRILLENLYTSNICNNLLIAEDEDQVWRRQSSEDHSAMDIPTFNKVGTSTMPFPTIVHGEYQFKPGYFECEMVWKKNIPIHARLCTSNTPGGPSKGLLAAQTEFIKRFRVENRQNIFVFRETKSSNVFYFRIRENEVPVAFESPQLPADSESVFTPVREDYHLRSGASSVQSLNKRLDPRFATFEFERQDSSYSNPYLKLNDEKGSISEGSSSHSVQQYVHFSVYGIREPGNEIKVELVKLITKKLDSATLDAINLSLERNYKCKLTPQDVEFIQPPGVFPVRKLQLCVSNYAVRYIHAVIYYLHQHLLTKFNTPRFTDSNPDHYFHNYCEQKPNWLTADPIYPNDMYLYNRTRTTGQTGNGVGIVYITIVDQDGCHVVVQPYYPTLIYEEYTLKEHEELFRTMTNLKKLDELPDDDTTMCRNILIEFSIWERGDIDIDTFEETLLSSLKHSLCDAFLEFQLFSTPICFVPKLLQTSIHSSRRDSFALQRCHYVRHNTHSSSSSSVTTTPKNVKPLTSGSNKKFFSEPTTPNDLKIINDSNQSNTKDDLSFISESPTKSKVEITPEEIDKRRKNILDLKRESPFSPLRKQSRESSPLIRKKSFNSRTSSVNSESDMLVPLPPQSTTPLSESSNQSKKTITTQSTTPSSENSNQSKKTITMSELNQMKLPVTSTYVMLTDAEVDESMRAVNAEHDKKSSTWQEIEITRRLELDKRKERRKLEHGLIGDLHSNYHENAATLLESILSLGNESMHKQEGLLHHQYVVTMVIKEFVKEMKDKSPDMFPKVYKCTKRLIDGVEHISYPRYIDRTAVKTEESDCESSMDLIDHNISSIIPGQTHKYIVIGHNAHKWLLSMGTDEAEISDNEEGKSTQEEHSEQKFNTLNMTSLGVSQDRRHHRDVDPPSCMTPTFVPRQKIFMAIFDQRKITLYTYNYSADVTASLDVHLKQLFAWNNVRTHLNLCLFTQKLGLFHHTHFVRDCKGNEDKDVASYSALATRPCYLPLMKGVSPKVKERGKTDQERIQAGVKVPDFDSMFRDIAPSKCLQHTSYFSEKDLVKRQAVQFEDVRRSKLILAYQDARLKEIYDAWKQEGAHIPITEERLTLLKKHSRFLHYCNAPLMFKRYNDEGDEDSNHLSDSTIIDDKSNSLDIGDASEMGEKDDWFKELKWTLVQQYIQYLQTLGLCLVQIGNKNSSTRLNPSSTSRRTARQSNRSSDGNKEILLLEERPSICHLQKTSIGGILLMKVFFKENYLCYKLSAFESVSLSEVGRLVSNKDQRNFHEDSNRFKDLTHLRSSVYDFHIRQIQFHLTGRHSVFYKGYPVHKLMEIILEEFPKAPRFSRCILADGMASLPCTPGLTPSIAYDYFVNHASKYELSKIQIKKSTNKKEHLPALDHLLTYSYSTEKQPVQFMESWRTRRDPTEYDGNVAVHFRRSDNTDVITLPYFVILGDKKEWYPRPQLLSSVSSLRRRQRTQSGMDQTTQNLESETVKQKSRVRFSATHESVENIIPQVHSTGSLKRMTSWSQALSSSETYMRTSVSSMRSSGSDSTIMSFSRSAASPRVSPGRSLVQFDVYASGSPESDVSLTSENNGTRYVSFTQEQFLHNELFFLSNEVNLVRDSLNKKIGACLSNCWRDILWYELISNETFGEDDGIYMTSSKKSKKKSANMAIDLTLNTFTQCLKEWQIENKMAAITPSSVIVTHESLRMLIGLVSQYLVDDFDSRISESFHFIPPGVQQTVLRNLILKYGPFCRRFLSDDGNTSYLCILNPANLDAFFLCESHESDDKMVFSIVYRQAPTVAPLECKEEENLRPLEKASRNHIENVITCLCYNIWAQILQPT